MSRNSIIALIVFFVAVIAFFVLTRHTETQQRVQQNVLSFVRPLFGLTSNLSAKAEAVAKGMKTLPQLEEENRQLKLTNEQLTLRNQLLNDMERENTGLRNALGFKQRSQFKLVPARIIARSSATWWTSVQIDRGERDGLDSDMPVVVDEGLVGKTTTVAENTAYVLLITDEGCKVAATVESTRENGILSGERTSSGNAPELSLNFLAKTAVPQLKPGLKVFSSGVGGVFPSGLVLGEIRSVEMRALDARARVSPAVNLARLENVFVVVGQRETPPAPTPAPRTR
ncbi:MAG: rod shape-determining protein MreC [Verrucomicrobia bacterium]|nr:rod shape-determining protein MreC [Verrucomicrobiota bacterium]